MKKLKEKELLPNAKKSQKNIFFAIVGILFLFWGGIWLVYDAKNFSITSDEIVYLPVGIRYLERGDELINNEHPPIFKIISALPAMFLPHNIDKAIIEGSQNQWKFGFTFWFESSNNVDNLLHAGRAPTILLTLLLFLSVWLWTRRNIGEWAGIAALGALVFNPNLIAHGSLIANDIYLAAAAWFLFVATFYFIKNANLKTAFWWGAGAFFAVLSKYTGVIFVAISILIVISSVFILRKNLWRSALLILFSAMVGLVLTWSVFIFIQRNSVFSARPVTMGLSDQITIEVKNTFKKIILLPYSNVRDGIIATEGHNKIGHRSYLNGEISQFGWKSYFLWALWYKTPIIILFLTLFGLILAVVKKNWALVLSFISVIVALAVGSIGHIQTGVRYILFFYVLSAPLAGIAVSYILGLKNVFYKLIVGILFIFLLFDSVRGGSGSISYFSYLTGGGSNGFKHLADSNLDWGQEFYILRDYVEKNKISNLIIGISSGEDPKYANIKSQPLINYTCDTLPAGSTVIASANYVVGFFGPYTCLLDSLKSGKAERLGQTFYIFSSDDLSR